MTRKNGWNLSADQIKHQPDQVIPRTFSLLTFVNIGHESFMAIHSTFCDAIAFIYLIDNKWKHAKDAFRVNSGESRMLSRLPQVF